MNATGTVNAWLAGINPADAGMVLNRFGQCELVCGTQACIVFVPGDTVTEFHLLQDIVDLPSQCESRIFEDILALNLPGQVTRSGALAFDASTRKLVFTCTRDIAATDQRQFCALLDNFLDAALDVRERVVRIQQHAAPGARNRQPARHPSLHQLSQQTSIKS